MPQTHANLEDVLEVLHAQGSKLITLEVLEEHCTLLEDYSWGEGSFPNLAFANGVRWMYDKGRRPVNDQGHPKKAIAPKGRRALIGDVDNDKEIWIFEGERDWLTAVSIGLQGAICAGGVHNLDGPDRDRLANRKKVTVVYDNDTPGQEASRKLASQLKLLECRQVSIFLPPLADADFSDWIESVDVEPELLLGHFLNDARERSISINKTEAKRIRDRRDAEDAPKERVQDEFVTPAGDLITLLFEPNRNEPWDKKIEGKIRFCSLDLERTRRDGLLVFEVSDKIELNPLPDEDDLPEGRVPEMYDGQGGDDHTAQRPAIVRDPVTLTPMPYTVYKNMNMRLPSAVQQIDSDEDLYKRIYDFVDRYWVAPPHFLHITVAYVLMTYRYNDLNMESIPYLRVFGNAGSGKSRFLRVMFEICNRAAYYTSIRSTHLYRLLQNNAGLTLIVDEFNIQDKSKESKETVDILNAGNQRDQMVPRWNADAGGMETIDPFCPKIFSNDSVFSDQGLLRRCISHQSGTLAVPEEKFFAQLPHEFFQEALILRNQLQGYRLKHFGEIRDTARVDEHINRLSSGVRQIWSALLEVVPDECVVHIPMMLEAAEDQDSALAYARENAPEISVATAAINVVVDGRVWYPDLLAHLNESDPNARWTQSDINGALAGLGVKRMRSKRKGDAERKNVYCFDINEAFSTRLLERRIQLDLSGSGPKPESPI